MKIASRDIIKIDKHTQGETKQGKKGDAGRTNNETNFEVFSRFWLSMIQATNLFQAL